MALALILAKPGFEAVPAAAQEGRALQLEVYINGRSTNQIAAFTYRSDGKMQARRDELSQVGIEAPGKGPPDQSIILDDIRGFHYSYDEPAQKILVNVGDALRTTETYDASSRPPQLRSTRPDWGAVMNYDVFTATNDVIAPIGPLVGGSPLTLDARAFSPYGTLSQSVIFRTSWDRQVETLRLNTTYSFSDQDAVTTYRVGDTITGGLAWTRSIRMGGFQVQRNFSLRPDLITSPLPTFRGSAAVPSTVDVYINNLKTFSQDVGSGPFQINNIPAVTGSGVARVVLRDAAGHESTSTQPFYASPSLLSPGLMDFSGEAGLPRVSFGSTDDAYLTEPVASASLRKGIFDWLTVEGHVEGGAGLTNGGIGAVLRTGTYGVVSGAFAASHYQNTGVQAYLSYETSLFGFRINASSQRTFMSYDDLASVTARLQFSNQQVGSHAFFDLLSYAPPVATSDTAWLDSRPPTELDRISFGLPPLSFDPRSNVGLSFIYLQPAEGPSSKILTTSWSRPISAKSSLFATAFSDLGTAHNAGFFAGLSVQFGDVSSMISVAGGKGGRNVTAEVTKPLEEKIGSYGWSLRDSEGAVPYRSAAVSYRSSFAKGTATVANDGRSTRATAEVDGAMAVLDGDLYSSNHIDDAFAVVETGVPNVGVSYENRPFGTTDSRGKLLIPSVRSYQKNKISIDLRDLPLDAEIDTNREFVAPADRSGVVVRFPVHTKTDSALLVLVGPDGKPLPVSSKGQIEGGEDFIVGYDGQAYVKGLKPNNIASVQLPDRQCRASFIYSPEPGKQVVISPVICQ